MLEAWAWIASSASWQSNVPLILKGSSNQRSSSGYSFKTRGNDMYRHHNKTSQAEKTETGKVKMSGKICMVTGANSGLGYEISLTLANMGAIVVMVCRNSNKGEEARKRMIAAAGNENIELIVADLSSQESLRELVGHFKSQHQQLHVLVNNAGHMSWNRQETVDGLEMTFAVNHLAPV